MNTTPSEPGPSRPSAPSEPPAGFESWRQSLARFTGLGLTDAEKAARDSESERRRLEKQWDRCERVKEDLMTRSSSLSHPH
jgi:inner membrane protease ATP23